VAAWGQLRASNAAAIAGGRSLAARRSSTHRSDVSATRPLVSIDTRAASAGAPHLADLARLHKMERRSKILERRLIWPLSPAHNVGGRGSTAELSRRHQGVVSGRFVISPNCLWFGDTGARLHEPRSSPSVVSLAAGIEPERPATLRCRAVVVSGPLLAHEDLELRRELTGYCYRMLGSAFEAEDAVQETLLRAWRSAHQFEGRSTMRSWVYRIATNVCVDMQRGVQRRARPMELGPASPPEESFLGPMLPECAWVSPIADASVFPDNADPAEIAATRETIRLAFVTALQHLPARQRATLILCDVLRWQAAETANLLDSSLAAVNSMLQRARATLARLPTESTIPTVAAEQAELLAGYVDAFERYDMQRLVMLLRDDALQSMPPFAMWIRGSRNIARWMLQPGPSACRGSRLLPTAANGCPAFGQYRPRVGGGYKPWALQVLEISGGRIQELHAFLDVERLFPAFGLPADLPA